MVTRTLSRHTPLVPSGRPRPDAGHHVHIGRFVHLGVPRATDVHQVAVDRRQRTTGFIDGLAALEARQTVIGPGLGALPPPTAGIRRVVRPVAPALPRWSELRHDWLLDRAARATSVAALLRGAVGATVHIHLQELDDLPAATLAAAAGVGPLVVHLGGSAQAPLRHGGTATVGSRLVGGPVERWLLRRATLVVAPSRRLAETASTHGARRVLTVPIGPAPRPADLPDEPGRPWPERTGRRLVAVGPLVPRRRSTALVACLATLPVDVELVLLGTGPDRLPVDRAVRRLGLTGRVHVVPSATRAQVAAHIAHADVVANASLAGDDTTQLLAAMSAGRPVVTTAVEGVPLHLSDGIDGLLVPPADTPALAAAIARMLHRPTAALTMGASARRRTDASGWELVAAQVVDALASTDDPSSGPLRTS